MVISVDGFTAARSQQIEDQAIVGGTVNGDGDLILTRNNSDTINAGNVMGATGPSGSGLIICTSGTRPGSPSGGDMIFETDTNRIYVRADGSWRWVWSGNGEYWVHKEVDLAANSDASGDATWPAGLELAVDVPDWATEFEAICVVSQAQQVTAASNTQLTLLIGAREIRGKRVRWKVTGADDERDIMIAGRCAVDDMQGTSQLFRLNGQKVSGSGALRVDDESNAYISGRFFDA